MKIATYNVNSIKARANNFFDWLKKENFDIIFLQEIKCETENFLYFECESLGYKVAVLGQKGYNGVAILCKYDFKITNRNLPNFRDVEARNTTSNSATINLMITDDGGSYITNYGVCYSTSENPTIMDDRATCYYCYGKAGNTFNLTDLEAGTTYYVRAYANSRRTSHGREQEKERKVRSDVSSNQMGSTRCAFRNGSFHILLLYRTGRNCTS